MRRVQLTLLAVVVAVSSLIAGVAVAQKDAPPDRRAVQKAQTDGNYKEAYEGFRLLTLDPAADPRNVGSDLSNAVACLRQLGNHDEIDAYMESVIELHKGNWRLLSAAADTYIEIEHFGTMVGGEFERGRRRGGRITHNAYERDRARALQLMVAAVGASAAEPNKPEVAQLHLQLARHLMGNRGYDAAWRLQYLTDLDKLPDYEEGHYSIYERYYWGGQRQGAPVDDDGNPVYYTVPESWQAAENDGQRWRWALAQAARIAPDAMAAITAPATNERLPYRLHESYELANFMLHQLGVQTMAEYGHFFGRRGETDETRKDESGTYELHTLGEDETIAKLATGIKRFKLPDEFNYMRIFRARADEGFKDAALQLARIFENRRQYPKAADFWRKYGDASRVNQIVGNWGQFEPIATQPAAPAGQAGQGATVDFRFRNGKKVTFTAHALKVKELLDDVKAYINTKPKQLDWQKMQVDNIGWRLVHDNQKKYMGEKAAEWTLDLEPRANHFDRRITVRTPQIGRASCRETV